MGKQQKSKSKISDLLPKAAAPVTFQSPPPSPARANSRKGCHNVSLIPKEIRRKARTLSFDTREPTSPKVSCMGKIKNRKMNKKINKPTKLDMFVSTVSWPGAIILRVFKGKQEIEESDDSDKCLGPTAESVSSLSQVKKFASGRGVLKDFDWKAHVVSGAVDVECIATEPRKEVNL